MERELLCSLINETMDSMELIVNERWDILDMLMYTKIDKEDFDYLTEYMDQLLELYDRYSLVLDQLTSMQED